MTTDWYNELDLVIFTVVASLFVDLMMIIIAIIIINILGYTVVIRIHKAMLFVP